ncbi:MAG: sterol desaturase family protein [Lewinellaceae bacterium]|nr:sterol desaturase family protein [Lewinellaceae bacterium]
MESIVDYFTHIPSSHRSAILLGGLTFFLLLEGAVPLFRWKYNKWLHAGINLFFTFTTVLVNFLMAFILLKSAEWVEATSFGLLQWMPEMPLLWYTLIGLLLLDLIGAYFVHWAEHKVKWMWRFHLVHHTDTNVDTTTANRHHPGESVFRFVFTTAGVVVCGAPIYLIFLYQSLSAALSQFNHANIRFPGRLDDALSWVLVTPRMHRVHHHYILPYTDSNYGNIFSIWDRLFGTFTKMDNEKIVFGIDTHLSATEHSELGNLLKMPFQRYRPPVGAKFESAGENESPEAR